MACYPNMRLLLLLCPLLLQPSSGAPTNKSNSTNVKVVPKPPMAATYLYDFTKAYESQVIRLRGDRPYGVPYIGQVEIFLDRRWGVICADSWSINEATVVCRMLGYRNASKAMSVAQVYSGEDHLVENNILLENLHCSGHESLLVNCSFTRTSFCPSKAIAAVECEADNSVCLPGELYANGFCYLISERPATYARAERVCDVIGGNLAWIDSPKTNTYVSEILTAFSHLYGRDVLVLSEYLHNFQIPIYISHSSNFLRKLPESSSETHCLALRRPHGDEKSAYFAMRATKCDAELPYICEATTLQKRERYSENEIAASLNLTRFQLSRSSLVPSTRIILGNADRVPFQAHVEIHCSDGKSWLCGGVILSSKWIISAAHCICKDYPERVTEIVVIIGRSEWKNDQGKTFTVNVADKESIIFGDNEGYPNSFYDIVLLKLNSAIEFGVIGDYNVYPISLTTAGVASLSNEVACFISGWGLTAEGDNNTAAHELQKAMVNIPQICQDAKQNVCVGLKETNTNACQGDSGGPLFCAYENGTEFLVGIISRQVEPTCENASSDTKATTETECVDLYPLTNWITKIASPRK